MSQSEVARIIDELGMQPHPEGGYYVETFREEAVDGQCPSTAIYYLLNAGESSHWHRVHGSSEIWHHYAGGSLTLKLSHDGKTVQSHRLGPDIGDGERPQVVVPAGYWQTATTSDKWALVGCTVAPGFEFENFELAPANWQPSLS